MTLWWLVLHSDKR